MFCFAHFFNKIQAQNNINEISNLATDTTKPELKQIEIDLLGSYYDQDGNNSPVTGGRGTENLQDITNNIIISIPYGKNVFSINIGQDNITSASTDNIDTDISSDSRKDSRTHGDIGVTRKITKRKSYLVGAGFSSEYDVTSFNLGSSYDVETKNRNKSFSFKGKVFYDSYVLYRPVELRNESEGDNTRFTYNFATTYTQVLTKKLQLALTAEITYQKGLLATPFHRVYFNDGVNTDALDEIETILSGKTRKRELLPDNRFKTPVSLRFHYYINSTFVFRGFYRYYFDDFGVIGNTFEIELPTRISRAIVFYPFYRYHTQTAADYFAPFGEHELMSKYYTSDFDLSDFDSHYYGLGFKYAPLFGVGRNEHSKKAMVKVKSINLRYANYSRSNNLDANLFSIGLSFTVF
ncbi:MAG: DUF3570 domain-containing protein [Vicingaceae bacterium]|nr:DUF3570 domain-containing protein [Vicingaceae bacterium]